MSDLKDSLHVLSPGDKSLPHVHSIITGRKSWKTLKGKTEAVWPPYLEAALFEGLAKYQPSNPRATKSLGRFPNRNRFISEYINKTTGKYRTPKQVGSRLQQLRDTCQGKQLLHSLSKGHCQSSAHSDDDNSPPPTPVTPGSESQGPSRTVVSIDILPVNISRRSSIDSNAFPAASPHSSTSNSPASSPTTPLFPPSFGNCEPRPIHVIDPTVTFTSRTSMMAYSSFTVLLDGVCVHTEVADLKLSTASCPVSPTSSDVDCIFFYSTTLVPQYWKRLCQSEDPTRYAIIQNIIQQNDSSTAESSSGIGHAVILSIEYRFNYPDTPYPSPQLSPTETTSSAGSSALPSPTAYNFDFISGYANGEGPEQAYHESNVMSQVDFLANASSICFPNYSPGTASSLGSPDLDLSSPHPLSSYGHYGPGGNEVATVEKNPLTITSDPFLPVHYAL